MSLTSKLKEADSPLSQWFLSKKTPSIDIIIKEHNQKMSRQEKIKPVNYNQTDFPAVGTAVTYGVRHYLGCQILEDTGAFEGLSLNPVKGLREYIEAPTEKVTELAYKMLLLVQLENYWRKRTTPNLIEACTKQDKFLPLPLEKLENWQYTIADIANILAEIPQILQTVAFPLGEKIKSNVSFPLSRNLGGADCQIIAGKMLLDVRVSAKRRPFTLENWHQQLSYLLLDTEDVHQIRQLVWFYPRQRTLISYPVNSLFKDLQQLRQEFAELIEEMYPVCELENYWWNDYYDYYDYCD